jgi:HAE1 family hydrophobic/amphiphilic exporter-1
VNLREGLPRFSVQRPVTVVVAFLVVLVVGFISLSRIPRQMMPSGFSPPYLWVWVPYADSSPAETEARVTKPLEEQLAGLPGLKHLESDSRSDNASLSLEFHASVDMDEAYNAVTDRIERATPGLPDDIERVWIWRFDPTDEPVIWAGIRVPQGTEDAHHLVTNVIQKRLERIPGVGRVDVWGVDEPVVWVDFDREALARHGVDLVTLMGRLSSDNFQLASGQVLERGEVRYVRALARWPDLATLRALPVAPGVRLADVAAIRHAPASSADINRIDGQSGAGIGINKESGANTVELCEAVRAALAELERDPRLAGFAFPVFFDQGALIQDSMDTLVQSAVEGGLLAVLVLVLFLREWRITGLIAATIPASLLLTITIMDARGDSLNLLSMLGLMLAVGMVVDNAVVVVETIYRRRQQGEDARTAAIAGTSEVLLPIVLSTLTSIVVFLPVILMSEDATFSFFMAALGLPVVFIQVGSLLITLLFTPLSTVWLGGEAPREDPAWVRRLAAWVDRGVHAALRRPVDTLVGVLALTILTVVLPARAVGCSESAEGNLGEFTVRFEVPRAYTYTERLRVVETFERIVESRRETWGVRVHRSRLSANSTRGRLYVYLDEDGPLARSEVLEQMTDALPDLPGVTASVGRGEGPGDDEGVIRFDLRGEDTAELVRLGEEARRRARALPFVRDARSEVEADGEDEVRLRVRREEAARIGLGASAVGRLVSFAMRGAPLPAWQDGDRDVRVFARFAQEDRQSVADLLDLTLTSAPRAGGDAAPVRVPLRAVASADMGRGWGGIHRSDRRTTLGITVELADGTDKDNARAAVLATLQGMDWPPDYGVDLGSDWQDEQASDDARNLALVLSVVFVFLIMGVLFESFLLPMVVITTIPMALLGVYWGLWASGTPFDVMGGVGMVILVGIVVNNGIVLVDKVTELRAEGVAREDALREAVRTRLRPILMTALSAAVGVVPMSLGDASFVGIPYAPLGRVILSGMLVATVLTLFFVPWLYAALDDLRATGARWWRWVGR